MWTIFKHSCETGEWTKGKSFGANDVPSLVDSKLERNESDQFIFWDGDLPTDAAHQQEIFEQAFAINEGKLLRVVLGGETQRVETALSSCSGNCFCVIARGMRRCETQYCNSNGYCWWVPCGSSC